jgi:hypothetical protein
VLLAALLLQLNRTVTVNELVDVLWEEDLPTRQAQTRRSLAHGALGIARVLTRKGDHRAAIQHTTRALEIYERIGHRSGAGNALNNLGWYHAMLGACTDS